MPDKHINTETDIGFDKGSFRDRTSRVLSHQGRIFRVLDASAKAEWDRLQQQPFYQHLLDEQKIVHSTTQPLSSIQLSDETQHDWAGLLEHQLIPFISYPYEWCFTMLKDAALLHLDLIQQALDADMILKDATPYNIQWQGASPVFIDVASFVKLPQGGAWAGYRQFCELFLFPLMLQSYKDIPFQPWLRGSLEGIQAMDFCNLLSVRDTFRSGVLLHGIVQAKLQNRYKDTDKDVQSTMKQAGFNKELIKHNITSIKRLITKLQWKQSKSTWSHYTNEHNYSSQDMNAKEQLIDQFVSKGYKLVWDFGCNTGKFSRIAAKHSDYVLAIDFDALAIDYLYKELKQEGNKKILPLIFNLSDPSPNIGWRNMERKLLTQRGRPELILSLALIHHLVIGANIPMDEVFQYFHQAGGDLVIEFVDRQDSMVKKLLLNKEDTYDDYTIVNFERLLSNYYDKIEKHTLDSGHRSLYLAQRSY